MNANLQTRMTASRAVFLAEGADDDAPESEIIEAWQYLHDTGLAYTLQGSFGRTAIELLRAGIIE